MGFNRFQNLSLLWRLSDVSCSSLWLRWFNIFGELSMPLLLTDTLTLGNSLDMLMLLQTPLNTREVMLVLLTRWYTYWLPRVKSTHTHIHHMVLSKNSCFEILVGTTGPLCEDDWNAGSRKLRGSDAEASDALFHDVLLVPLGNVLL